MQLSVGRTACPASRWRERVLKRVNSWLSKEEKLPEASFTTTSEEKVCLHHCQEQDVGETCE